MSLLASRFEGRYGLALAWLVLVAATLLVTLPVLFSLAGVWQAWQGTNALRQDVDRLTIRVEQHFDDVNDWYSGHGETADTVLEYSDPAVARQAFDARLDLISQALIDAGAHLERAPATRDISLGNGINALAGDLTFAGPLTGIAQALITLRGQNVRVAAFSLEALPGQPEGRVRGQMQIRQPYLLPEGGPDGG